MKIEHEMLAALAEIVENLNLLAAERAAADPLAETAYSLKVTSPYGDGHDDKTRIEGLHVLVTVSYSSGGGPESAYVLNDTVSFIATAAKITQIAFEKDSMLEKRADIDTGDGLPEEFLADIRRFCESALPPELNFDVPSKG